MRQTGRPTHTNCHWSMIIDKINWKKRKKRTKTSEQWAHSLLFTTCLCISNSQQIHWHIFVQVSSLKITGSLVLACQLSAIIIIIVIIFIECYVVVNCNIKSWSKIIIIVLSNLYPCSISNAMGIMKIDFVCLFDKILMFFFSLLFRSIVFYRRWHSLLFLLRQ